MDFFFNRNGAGSVLVRMLRIFSKMNRRDWHARNKFMIDPADVEERRENRFGFRKEVLDN